MANVARISGFQPPKAISTAEGAKALRLLSSYPAWGERNLNEARRWISPAVKAALPAQMQEAEDMISRRPLPMPSCTWAPPSLSWRQPA